MNRKMTVLLCCVVVLSGCITALDRDKICALEANEQVERRVPELPPHRAADPEAYREHVEARRQVYNEEYGRCMNRSGKGDR